MKGEEKIIYIIERRYYVLNYTRKNINVIALIVTIIICLILFIILDMIFLNNANKDEILSKPIYTSSIRIEEYNNIKRKGTDAMKVDETFQGLMQIADIYDEDTMIDDLSNENNGEELSTTGINGLGIAEMLDKNNNWRIKIPKINVNAPIKTGTSQEILALAVGHFPESTKWNGNVALAGHNRGYRCNFFQNIKDLEIGDKIIYSTNQGERTYKVVLNKIIKQTDWTYLQETKDNRLTLITCVENMHDYRRCIQAVEVT